MPQNLLWLFKAARNKTRACRVHTVKISSKRLHRQKVTVHSVIASQQRCLLRQQILHPWGLLLYTRSTPAETIARGLLYALFICVSSPVSRSQRSPLSKPPQFGYVEFSTTGPPRFPPKAPHRHSTHTGYCPRLTRKTSDCIPCFYFTPRPEDLRSSKTRSRHPSPIFTTFRR